MTADLAHIRYSEMWGKQLPLQLRSEIHPVLQFCFTEPPNASTALRLIQTSGYSRVAV
ncbi:hypothetical protein IG631_08955 [Alternaria alternata]|nr:hypothetical protein IG631_08955 [Alternaria alternata]